MEGVVTELVGGDRYIVKGAKGINWPIRSIHVELIDDGDSKQYCWYYLKSFNGDRVAVKPVGYYLDGEDLLIGPYSHRIGEGLKQVVTFLLSKQFTKEHIKKLVKEYQMGCNRREDFVPETKEESNMAERKPCPKCGKEFTWMADGSRPRVHKCEPMAQVESITAVSQGPVTATSESLVDEEPKPQPKGPAVDRVLEAYITTRNEIAAQKKIFDEKVADLKKFQAAREQWLAKTMEDIGVTNLKMAGVGIAFFKTKSSATVADATQFTEWVLEDWDGRNHYLERKVSKTAVDEALEEGGVQPPGVNYTTIRVVQVQKT